MKKTILLFMLFVLCFQVKADKNEIDTLAITNCYSYIWNHSFQTNTVSSISYFPNAKLVLSNVEFIVRGNIVFIDLTSNQMLTVKEVFPNNIFTNSIIIY